MHAPSGSIIDSEASTPRSIQSPVSPQSPISPASPAEKMMESSQPDLASAISRMGKSASGRSQSLKAVGNIYQNKFCVHSFPHAINQVWRRLTFFTRHATHNLNSEIAMRCTPGLSLVYTAVLISHSIICNRKICDFRNAIFSCKSMSDSVNIGSFAKSLISNCSQQIFLQAYLNYFLFAFCEVFMIMNCGYWHALSDITEGEQTIRLIGWNWANEK